MEANENTNTDIDVMDNGRQINWMNKKQKVIYQRSSS